MPAGLSLRYLAGAEIDFVDDLIAAAFILCARSLPNIYSADGCSSSCLPVFDSMWLIGNGRGNAKST
jgi:hypothetical protein